MKITVKRPVEIEVTHILIRLPVRYEEEDIPNDFPLRDGDVWEALVEIDTGKIVNWPSNHRFQECSINNMKVSDEGTYVLLCGTVANSGQPGQILGTLTEVARLENEYVPHGVVPGVYGDYVELDIKNGVITNWPKKPNLSRFFKDEEDS